MGGGSWGGRWWKRVCGIGMLFFFFQAEDGIRDYKVTGVQTCALPIFRTLRRHTQWRDLQLRRAKARLARGVARALGHRSHARGIRGVGGGGGGRAVRSEERRVGEEGRSRGSPDH